MGRRRRDAGRTWIHAALAVKARFLLELCIGPRTLEMACQLLAAVAEWCRPGEPLLIEADEHRPYPQAILKIFGVTRFRRRRHGHGRYKYPDLKPPPGLRVGVVHKVRDRCRRVLRVKARRLCGRLKDIRRCLKRLHLGSRINTGHIERLNGTLRTQQAARLARRTRQGSRQTAQLQAALFLWRDAYHWLQPHAALGGRTPAMALGLTHRCWSMLDYARHPVHVGPFQLALWRERRDKLLTTGLNEQKHRKHLPTF